MAAKKTDPEDYEQHEIPDRDPSHPETKWERKRRLRPWLSKQSTCPTTNGQDLEVWEELCKSGSYTRH